MLRRKDLASQRQSDPTASRSPICTEPAQLLDVVNALHIRKSLTRFRTRHVFHPGLVEVVPHAPGAEHGIANDLYEFPIERVVRIVNGPCLILFVAERDVLQPFENGEVPSISSPKATKARISRKLPSS